MDTIEQLLQRGQAAQGGGGTQALLSAPEAEHIISQLAALTIEEVGGPKWNTQHEWIERLNLQAHYNAVMHSDEFVVELLVSLDKMPVLVHDLLVIEAWKQFVYPLLAPHLAEQVDSVTAYLLLYHEVTVANLLQVTLYHSNAVESLPEDYALELADWCYRKLTRLNTEEGRRMAEPKEHSAEELLKMSRLEEQEEKRRELEFSVMMCSLAILRYLTDGLAQMPMGALSRLVSTNDTLMGLLPLLDRPPWVRTRVPPPGAGQAGGGRPVLEKWAGNKWAVVPPADRLKITQTDGQVWLAVTNLLVDPRCRAKYGMDEYRRERILGLKRHLNELMFDQLPVLKDLQRVIDELALGVLPDQGGAGRSGALILEAVPVVRDALLRGRNWREVAERAKREHFGPEARRMAQERVEAMLKHLDFLCELEPETPAGPAGSQAAAASAAGPAAPVKVSTWRKVHDSGVYEAWYDFSMEVDDSRPPEPVEVAAGPSGGGGAAAAAPAVHGLRYRLRPLDVDSTRPLPANGKAVVRWGSLVSEALLQLPELPTRDSAEGAAVLWVTVGLLAVDGLVLQVKLKKAPKPKERDRVAGVWYAYHPVAGALTVLRDHVESAAASSNKADAAGRGGAAAAAAKGGSTRPLVQVISQTTAAGATARKAADSAPAPAPASAAAKSGAGAAAVASPSSATAGTAAPAAEPTAAPNGGAGGVVAPEQPPEPQPAAASPGGAVPQPVTTAAVPAAAAAIASAAKTEAGVAQAQAAREPADSPAVAAAQSQHRPPAPSPPPGQSSEPVPTGKEEEQQEEEGPGLDDPE